MEAMVSLKVATKIVGYSLLWIVPVYIVASVIWDFDHVGLPFNVALQIAAMILLGIITYFVRRAIGSRRVG